MKNVFNKYLGAANVIWLNKGIAGDDTHGHVDDITRFVNRNTVVTVIEDNPNDANYNTLDGKPRKTLWCKIRRWNKIKCC